MTQSDNFTTDKPTPINRRRLPLPLLKILAVLIILIIAGIWFAFWLHHRLTHVTGDDAQVRTHEITVSSRLSGQVTHFSLIIGDRLHNGDPIAQLYSKPDELKLAALQAQVDNVNAQLQTEQVRLERAKHLLADGIAATENLLQTDIAAEHAANADMLKAQDIAQRSEKLYESHSLSAQQRDNDRYSYLSAHARYEQAKRQVELDRVALNNAHDGLLIQPQMSLPSPAVLQSEEAATRSHLDEVKAQLAHQLTRVHDLLVRSLGDGVVDQTFISQGDYVSAGQPILMMHDPKDVWIEAKLKETKIQALKVGLPVDIHVDALPNAQFRGHIQVIGRAATNQFALLPDPNPSGNFTKITQRIPVRIAIDHGPIARLGPGMMVEVDIDTTAPAEHGSQQGSPKTLPAQGT